MTTAEQKINALFSELVPVSGKADTVAGEIVRAVSRISYRNYNDGDHIGVGYGKELHDGDTIVYESGREEKLYLTTDGTLGTDATNPHWISTGRAIPCEYGIYPLELSDLREARLKPAQ